MKQTYLPEHFPQTKGDIDLNSLKRKTKETDCPLKSLKIEEQPLSRCKLNIPPSKVSDLSLDTMNILNSLNLHSSNIQLRSSEEVLNSVSAREKYQDLLDPYRKLSLPYKYKRLLKLQEYIDTIISNAKIRKIPTAFNNIKQAIENTYEATFELESLQKILYLCPELYSLHWDIDSNEEQLIIDFPDNSSYYLSVIHNRNSMLKKELLLLTKKYHNNHLSALSTQIVFDPEVNNTWHSSFNLHEVPDIQLANLPEKNNQESPTVAKVSIGKQLRAARLISLCKIIKKIFSCHKTPSIFLKSLVKKIQVEKIRNEDPKLIENDVLEICEIFHSWIGIIKTASGEVIRINKQTDFSIKSASIKIKKKYN